MKTIAVIPARYASTRMPGKPLADVLGKPMIWWVYQAAKACPKLDDVLIATDDERIEAVCQQYGFNCVAFSLAVCYGANLCFATPLANAQTGTTMVAGYRFKDYLKYNLLLEVFVWIGIVVFMPMFWNLTV